MPVAKADVKMVGTIKMFKDVVESAKNSLSACDTGNG